MATQVAVYHPTYMVTREGCNIQKVLLTLVEKWKNNLDEKSFGRFSVDRLFQGI